MLARMLLLAALLLATSAAPAIAADAKFCGWRGVDGRWSNERPDQVWMRASAKGIGCSRARKLIIRSAQFGTLEGPRYRCRTRESASSEWSRTVRCVRRSNPDVVLRWKVLDQ